MGTHRAAVSDAASDGCVSKLDPNHIAELHRSDDLACFVGELDAVAAGELVVLLDIHGGHIDGIGTGLGFSRREVGQLLAVLIVNIHVVAQVEVEPRHMPLRNRARSGFRHPAPYGR